VDDTAVRAISPVLQIVGVENIVWNFDSSFQSEQKLKFEDTVYQAVLVGDMILNVALRFPGH
jgi:hypothetical protein